MAIVGELGDLLNVFACAREALEDGMEVSTWLHGNDSELIFLIDPHEESLCVIVEDTSSFGPLAVKSASLQESITLPILNINIFEEGKRRHLLRKPAHMILISFCSAWLSNR